MADDVNIRLKTEGGRQAAREADRVASSVGGIGRRARAATGGMRLFNRATVSAAGGMRLAGGAAIYGSAAIGGVLLIGLKRSTDAWAESRAVAAQTGAVLKSTGGVANVTGRHVGDLAATISRKTGVDDEAIQSGENLLLTFKKVHNEAGRGNTIFDRATKAAVDLSAAGFGSINSASIQLGKALNDPVKGMTALNRSGVTFTAGQKKRIEGLVAEGDLLGAQKILLREVESQVGGSAAAQATPLKRLKVSWGNLEETIGKGVSPAVDAVAGKLDRFLVRANPAMDRLGASMGKIWKGDATVDMKLFASRREIRRQLGPFGDEFRAELRRSHLGDVMGDAFEEAAPRIADAAGKNAGRAAKAFVGAWWDADIGGKLFVAGLISWKLGAFKTAANLAFAAFLRQWKRHHLPVPVPTDAPLPGRRPKPGEAPKPRPRGSLLRKAGRFALDVGGTATVIPGAFFAGAEYREQHAANRGVNVPAPGRRVRSPTTTSGAFQYNRPRVAAPRRGGDIVIHSHMHMDGKEVARSVHRHAKDADANKRGG
jgi:hypothetical protein